MTLLPLLLAALSDASKEAQRLARAQELRGRLWQGTEPTRKDPRAMSDTLHSQVLVDVTREILDGMHLDGWWGWDDVSGKRVFRHDRPSAWDVNCGMCEEWADAARSRLGGEIVDLASLKTGKFKHGRARVMLPRGIFDDVSHVVLLLDGRF